MIKTVCLCLRCGKVSAVGIFLGCPTTQIQFSEHAPLWPPQLPAGKFITRLFSWRVSIGHMEKRTVCQCAEVTASVLYMELYMEYEESEVLYCICQSEGVHVWTYCRCSRPCFDNTYSLQKASYIISCISVSISLLEYLISIGWVSVIHLKLSDQINVYLYYLYCGFCWALCNLRLSLFVFPLKPDFSQMFPVYICLTALSPDLKGAAHERLPKPKICSELFSD